MSVERKLLGRWHNGDLLPEEYMQLMKETKELLAQPEQTEQQAEAWIIVNKQTGYRTQVSDLTPFLYHREIFEVIPLYTAPPKREPLSDEEIHAYLSLMEPPFLWDEGFCSGIEWAEKQHGIGGGEE